VLIEFVNQFTVYGINSTETTAVKLLRQLETRSRNSIAVFHAACRPANSINLSFPLFADRLLLHDQPMPSCHRHAVFRDQEKGNGTHATRERAFPLYEHPSVVYEQFRAHILLRWNCKVSTNWKDIINCITTSNYIINCGSKCVFF